MTSIPAKIYSTFLRKEGRLIFYSGIVAIILILVALVALLTAAPIVSEYDELVKTTIDMVKATSRSEWVEPDYRHPFRGAAIELQVSEVMTLFRFRIFIIVAATEAAKLNKIFFALLTSSYNGRQMPIDIEIHFFGRTADGNSPMASMPNMLWSHGRYSVFHHATLETVDDTIWTVWMPLSNFELGLFLFAESDISPMWFQWIWASLYHYSRPSFETDSITLPTVEGAQGGKHRATNSTNIADFDWQLRSLESPFSRVLSGIALDLPADQAKGDAARHARVHFLSPLPSRVTFFTARFWRSFTAHRAASPALPQRTSWIEAVEAYAVTLYLSKSINSSGLFLYPPFGITKQLACASYLHLPCSGELGFEAENARAPLQKLPVFSSLRVMYTFTENGS